MRLNVTTTRRDLLRREDGFTMLFALLALVVGALLVAAAFTAANGDIKLTRKDTSQKEAYYAALAGVEQYKYKLNSNPNYWIKCPGVSNVKVTGTTDETYTVKTLASTGHSTCESEKQLTIIETSGSASGTFRIESTGSSEGVKRSIVATFTHPGFLNYVYFSNYEVEDPTNFKPEPTNCEHYYKYRVEHGLTKECGPIQFAAKDKVNGPMHTNDSADICAEGSSKPTFGRSSADKIEMNGGHYAQGGCSNSANMVGTYTESAPTLLPPETDNELLESAGLKFSGKTIIELKSGNPNTMKVTNNGSTTIKNFPTNGVIFVENSSSGCSITYTPFDSDYENDTGCGNVYVKGAYTESLTIAAANDVIINGSVTTTSETKGEPTGGATLGLIATNFVRLYHPVKRGKKVENYYTPATSAPFGAKKESCLPVKYKGKETNTSTSVTGLTATEGLLPGTEVSGTGILAGTKVVEVNAVTKTIVLSNPAKSTGEFELTFTLGLGFSYRSAQNLCVEKAKSGGYVYHESENLYAEECEASTTYVSEGFCEYEITSKTCSSKATNLSVAQDPNGWGALASPTIDAAILSTHHSFIVDNYKCGAQLGELNVWGSIAQFWRGPVGTGGGSGTGYIKNYNYDDRLAVQQPPNFLSPSTTAWKLSRETAPPISFG
jgi:hypothetical protein